MRVLMFWGIVLASSLVSLFSPFLGLTCYFGIAHTQLTGFLWAGTTGNYGMILAGAIMAGYAAFGLRKSPPRVRGLVFMLLLWVWLAASAFQAYDRTYSIPKLVEYSKIFVLSLLTAALVNTEQRIKTALRVIAASLGLLGVHGTLTFVATAGQARLRGPGSLIGDENEFALAMNMGIALLVFLARTETNKKIKLAFLSMAGTCAITVIGTHSRSGLLGMIVVGLVIVAVSKRKLLGLAAVGVASAALLLVLPDSALERYRTIENASTQDESAIGRLQSWETARRMVKEHPFFGVGPKNFVPVYSHYSNYFPRAPHNGYIALAAESGLPACLFYVLMLGSTIMSLFFLRLRLRGDEKSETLCGYALTVQCALIASLVPNLFINRQDYDLIYHLVAIGAGVAFLGRIRFYELMQERDKRLAAATKRRVVVQPELDPVG